MLCVRVALVVYVCPPPPLSLEQGCTVNRWSIAAVSASGSWGLNLAVCCAGLEFAHGPSCAKAWSGEEVPEVALHPSLALLL